MAYYSSWCVFWCCLCFPFLLLRSCYVALADLELCTVVWPLACGGPLAFASSCVLPHLTTGFMSFCYPDILCGFRFALVVLR